MSAAVELCVLASCRPEKICVRWSPDANVGLLSKLLSALGGEGFPVVLKPKGVLRRFFLRRSNLTPETTLRSLAKTPLEASTQVRAAIMLQFPGVCRAVLGTVLTGLAV